MRVEEGTCAGTAMLPVQPALILRLLLELNHL